MGRSWRWRRYTVNGRIVAGGPKAEVLISAQFSDLYQAELRIDEHGGWYRCLHAGGPPPVQGSEP